jgi:hypothetical protein
MKTDLVQPFSENFYNMKFYENPIQWFMSRFLLTEKWIEALSELHVHSTGLQMLSERCTNKLQTR